MRAHIRFRRGIAGGIALAVALSVSAVSTITSGAVAATRTAKVDKNAVLRYGLPIVEQGGVFFDPSKSSNNPYARIWLDLIYDSMIHDTPDHKGAPGLATKWSTPDPQTVEITLRDGVKYPDGSAFNSAAVKAAWERLRASDVAILPQEIKAITAIETPDDKTVRVSLGQPVAKQWVDEILKSSVYLGVPSPKAVEAGTSNTKPVGVGPYQFESYEEGQKITLTKNPDYWNPKAQKLKGVELIQSSVGATQLTALQGGTVDLIAIFPPDAIKNLESAGFVISSTPSTQVKIITLCVSDGPFAQKKARQALQYALDRKGINEAALFGAGTPTSVMLTPVSPFYDKSLEKTYSFNPKKAKTLFKQGGVKPGSTIRALVATTPPQPAIAEIVQSNLKDLGFKVEITQSTNVPADSARLKPDMDFVSIDPSFFALAIQGQGPLNTCGWSNPEASAALDTARDSSKSEAEVGAAWDKLQRIVLDESPFVVVVVNPLLAAHTKKVKGVQVMHNIVGPDLSTVYMVK